MLTINGFRFKWIPDPPSWSSKRLRQSNLPSFVVLPILFIPLID